MPGKRKGPRSCCEVLSLHEQIVSVKRGNSEDADASFRQRFEEGSKDASESKIQRAGHSQTFPSTVRNHVRWHLRFGTDHGEFIVRSRDTPPIAQGNPAWNWDSLIQFRNRKGLRKNR